MSLQLETQLDDGFDGYMAKWAAFGFGMWGSIIGVLHTLFSKNYSRLVGIEICHQNDNL